MFDTRNDLPPGVRTKVVKVLRLADAIDLADKYLWFLEAHLHGRG